MAAREDANPERSILAGKEKVHETTHVVAGEVRLPESGFARQGSHKVRNFDKPVKCGKSGCRLEAAMRVDMHGQGPKNYCSQHWAKIEPNTESYDPDTKMVIRPEYGQDIRSEDRVTKQQTRAEAAAEIFKHTGIHFPVRGPGNPRDAVDPEAEIEDHITPVIDSAVERGGRNVPATTSVDAAALMHKLKVGGAPKTQDQKLSEIGEELERNPSTKASNSFDEYEGLMGHQD